MANRIAQGVAAVFMLSSVVESAHFMGGTIQWRPLDPEAFNGTIQIYHRFAWIRAGGSRFCTDADIGTTRLFGDRDPINCRSGCSGTVGHTDFYCTEYFGSTGIGSWIVGERTHTYDMADVTNFEIWYQNGNWIYAVGDGDWAIKAGGSLFPRSDNGQINSPPRTTFTPLRLQGGCTHNISIPVQDLDQDTVRCRWAQGRDECHSVCNSLPGAVLDQDTCTITWTAPGSVGTYAVAIQIEDFVTPLSTYPLSSVPLQFTLDVFTSPTTCTGGIRPTLVPGETPSDGACITVPVGTTYRGSIVADSGLYLNRISRFIMASPFGLVTSPVTQSQYISTHYFSNITWTPTANQTGLNLFCFQAMNTGPLVLLGHNLIKRWCVTFSGGESTTLLINSVSPTGALPLTLTSTWEIIFDGTITRPRTSRYVRFYEAESRRNIYNVDVTSSAASYPLYGNTLTLSFSANFTAGLEYYVLMDSGVATGGACSHSRSITNRYFWRFSIAPLSVQLTIAETNLTELETTTVECTVIGGAGNSDLTLWRNEELLVQIAGDYLIYTTTPGAYGDYTCAADGFSNSSLLYERVQFQLLFDDINNQQCNFIMNQLVDLEEAILTIFTTLCPQCEGLYLDNIVDTQLICSDYWWHNAYFTATLVYTSPDGQITASTITRDFQRWLSTKYTPALIIHGTRYTLDQRCPVQHDTDETCGNNEIQTVASDVDIVSHSGGGFVTIIFIIAPGLLVGVVITIITIVCVRKIRASRRQTSEPKPAAAIGDKEAAKNSPEHHYEKIIRDQVTEDIYDLPTV